MNKPSPGWAVVSSKGNLIVSTTANTRAESIKRLTGDDGGSAMVRWRWAHWKRSGHRCVKVLIRPVVDSHE